MMSSIVLAGPSAISSTQKHSSVKPSAEQRAAYQALIDDASRDDLWAIMLGMCILNSDWKEYFAEQITAIRKDRERLGLDDDSKNTSDILGKRKGLSDADVDTIDARKTKKKAKRANAISEICGNCGDVLPVGYEELEDDLKDCICHDGNLEMDEERDFFADHDEPYDMIDSMEYRIQYPQGFQWDCCDLSGDSEGCTVAQHEIGPRRYHAKLRAIGFEY